jgi:hypothetical protein
MSKRQQIRKQYKEREGECVCVRAQMKWSEATHKIPKIWLVVSKEIQKFQILHFDLWIEMCIPEKEIVVN